MGLQKGFWSEPHHFVSRRLVVVMPLLCQNSAEAVGQPSRNVFFPKRIHCHLFAGEGGGRIRLRSFKHSQPSDRQHLFPSLAPGPNLHLRLD